MDAAVFCLCGGKLVVVAEARAVVVSLCVTSSRCLGRLHGNLPNMLTPASCLTVSLLLSPSPQTFFTSPSPRAPYCPPASLSVQAGLDVYRNTNRSVAQQIGDLSHRLNLCLIGLNIDPFFVSVDVAFLTPAEQQLSSALRALINQTQLLNR